MPAAVVRAPSTATTISLPPSVHSCSLFVNLNDFKLMSPSSTTMLRSPTPTLPGAWPNISQQLFEDFTLSTVETSHASDDQHPGSSFLEGLDEHDPPPDVPKQSGGKTKPPGLDLVRYSHLDGGLN
ncbi:hypothetical protein BV25DRAFT_1819087 [Artomyces pyxidatus]|uniref:Uncharacterized protein n=1 Tax=Artomyces pyxidatus TaxID=48021 RepID=A0ACB8TGW3_9AGAM|nr:hypothetical protein BV25DRAFT_1819087 [Artomyces pyxidatus]